MSELNWHTDDDGDWDDLTSDTEIPAQAQNEKEPTAVTLTPRRITITAVLTLLLTIAIWQLYTTMQNRIESQIDLIETDVLASHHLVYDAVILQDPELMANLISGRSLTWSQAQIALIEEGYFFGRSQFGLHQLPQEQPHVEIVEFSPDLTAATVTIDLSYQTDHSATPIILQHTAVYKLGVSRWLLSPVDPHVDPQINSYQGEYIRATYPQEEAELIGRLVTDMDQTMRDVCNRFVDFMCSPATHQFNLTFASDPAALWATNTPQPPTSMTLPTPALFGLPTTDQGYRSLYQAYAFYIAPHLLDLTLREDSAMLTTKDRSG